MASMNIFSNDAFSVLTLTKWVNEQPFKPGAVGKLGLFADSEGVNTTIVAVENYGETLALVPSTRRGSNGTKSKRDTRSLRDFRVPHFKPTDDIVAEEVQNVRALGSDSEVEGVERVVQRKLKRLNDNLDATIELNRLGALQGIIRESDGAGSSITRYNLFTEFGVTQDSVDFVLGTTTTNQLDKCMVVRETMQNNLGGAGDDSLEVGAFCGSAFFRRLISHPTVAEAYKFYQTTQGMAQNPLQNDLRFKGFKFGDIWFWTYRGAVSGINFVASAEAHFFPMNVPDAFFERYAPADYMETVNTDGLPRYAKVVPDPSGYNRGASMEVQSNHLALCARPKALIKGTTSN
jgi:hypothetical protein